MLVQLLVLALWEPPVAPAGPVEVQAYLWRRGAPGPPEGERRALALTSRNWYPRLPANADVPAGYEGLLWTIGEPLSGLEIWLETEPGTAELEELAYKAPASPNCAEPVYEAARPMFEYLAKRAGRLYRSREEKLRAVQRWSQWVASPFDFLAYAEFLGRIEFDDEKDRAFAVSEAAAALARLEPTPCGATFLAGPVNLAGGVEQAAVLGPGGERVRLAHQEFLQKLMGAPVCRGDVVEDRARAELAKRAGIEAEDVVRARRERRVLDEGPAGFAEPADVAATRRGVERGDSTDEEWNEYEARWRAWQPERQGLDWRFEDVKLSSMPAKATAKAARMKLRYLAGHRLKREQPALWLGHVVRALEALKGNGPEETADETIAVLAAYIK